MTIIIIKYYISTKIESINIIIDTHRIVSPI